MKLTKRQILYIKNCCRDEIDNARELKKKYKKKGLSTGKFDTWIRKQKAILKNYE